MFSKSEFFAAAPALRVGIGRIAPPVSILGIVLVAWQTFVMATDVPAVILPTPTEVIATVVSAFSMLISDAAITAVTAVLGLTAGIAVGSILALAMTQSRTAVVVCHPFLLALRIVPLIAIAPLLFLWLGHGTLARAVLVSTLTVFPVTIASLDGLRTVPCEYLDAARSVGTSPWKIFFLVRVPAAAPSVFAGIKLAAALSVTGTVVAEFITLNAGLGYRIFISATNLQTPRMFAALFVLTLVGLGIYGGPALLERRIQWAE